MRTRAQLLAQVELWAATGASSAARAFGHNPQVVGMAGVLYGFQIGLAVGAVSPAAADELLETVRVLTASASDAVSDVVVCMIEDALEARSEGQT